jgi:hypothetical protein
MWIATGVAEGSEKLWLSAQSATWKKLNALMSKENVSLFSSGYLARVKGWPMTTSRKKRGNSRSRFYLNSIWIR